MHVAWWSALAFAATAGLVVFGMLLAAALIRVRAKDVPPTRALTYECGEEPEGLAWVRFHPRYYVVALVFVVFDVETAFLLPWALGLRGGGWPALVAMGVFMTVLLLGWAYAVRKGALKWQ